MLLLLLRGGSRSTPASAPRLCSQYFGHTVKVGFHVLSLLDQLQQMAGGGFSLRPGGATATEPQHSSEGNTGCSSMHDQPLAQSTSSSSSTCTGHVLGTGMADMIGMDEAAELLSDWLQLSGTAADKLLAHMQRLDAAAAEQARQQWQQQHQLGLRLCCVRTFRN
jgi:hypothetical protein